MLRKEVSDDDAVLQQPMWNRNKRDSKGGLWLFLSCLFDVQGTFIRLGNTILWRSRLHVYIAQYLLLKNISSLCVLPKLGGCSWDQGVLVLGATFCAFGSLPGLSILAYKRRPWAWCVCVSVLKHSMNLFHKHRLVGALLAFPREEFALLALCLESGVWCGYISSTYLMHISHRGRSRWDFY